MDRRNGRRRRVLREDSRGEGNPTVAETKQQSVLAYSESAQHQPSLTDLIPVRPLRVLTTMLASAAALLGLLVLDDWAATHQIAAFQMGQRGSLANWFASTLLMWAAGGAALTYLIRRHRKDDYRGAYYIWIWATVMLVFASIAATAPWHHHWNTALTHLTGLSLGQHGWWLSTIGVIALFMAVRISIDIRQCRTAFALLVLAMLGYAAVTLIETGCVLSDKPKLAALSCQFGVLASHLTLAYAVWWNARHVQLDAQGVLAERAAKRAATKRARDQRRNEKRDNRLAAKEQKVAAKANRKSKPATEEETKAESADKPTERRKPKVLTSKERLKQQDPADESDDNEEPQTLKMDGGKSKSEKRRDRRQKRRAA